jgi:hypothetical protein
VLVIAVSFVFAMLTAGIGMYMLLPQSMLQSLPQSTFSWIVLAITSIATGIFYRVQRSR